MGTPQTTKKSTGTSTAAATAENNAEFNIIIPTADAAANEQAIEYDIFGRPIKSTEAPAEDMQEIPTDEEGNLIEPTMESTTEPATDSLGNVIEEPTVDAAVEDNDEASADSTEAEDAGQTFTVPPGFSGYDHKVYDDEGNEIPTIPPDFVIIIE